MKPVTHAQKALMLQYFKVLEDELRLALKETPAAGELAGDASAIDTLAERVRDSALAIAARVEGSSAPSLQQVRKNLQAVFDPVFAGGAEPDPIKAVRALAQELREQPEYTKPVEGVWKPGPPRSRKTSNKGSAKGPKRGR